MSKIGHQAIGLQCYLEFMTEIGSIREARSAGRYPAMTDIKANTNTITVRVSGSVGLTP